jgi:hypothetical protein
MKPLIKHPGSKRGLNLWLNIARLRLSGYWNHLYSTDTNRNHHYYHHRFPQKFIVGRHASISVLSAPPRNLSRTQSTSQFRAQLRQDAFSYSVPNLSSSSCKCYPYFLADADTSSENYFPKLLSLFLSLKVRNENLDSGLLGFLDSVHRPVF